MKKQALVIGNNNYCTHTNNLQYCIADGTEITQLLSINGNSKIENFKVNFKTDLTAADMLSSIETLFVAERDIALLYYSGHGGLHPENHNTYLLGVDENPIWLSTIMSILLKSKAKSKVIILDSCYSGGMGNIDIGTVKGQENSLLPRGTVIMTASRENEVSFECSTAEHGMFTDLLISAMEGQAADLRGYITPGSIYSYIDSTLGELGGQRPVFKSNVDEFIPIRQVDALFTASELNDIDIHFPDKTYVKKLDSSYEETNVEKDDTTAIDKFTKQGYAVSHSPPYAKPENVAIFKLLQKYNRAGLVEPVDAEHMYGAAMTGKSCRLTNMGMFYWKIAANNRF